MVTLGLFDNLEMFRGKSYVAALQRVALSPRRVILPIVLFLFASIKSSVHALANVCDCVLLFNLKENQSTRRPIRWSLSQFLEK
jgi:hypothetical protein